MSRRLRIFAGPNGSGKTTLYRITQNKFHLGVMVNADVIEHDIRSSGVYFVELTYRTENIS